jgi:hypothetical protein
MRQNSFAVSRQPRFDNGHDPFAEGQGRRQHALLGREQLRLPPLTPSLPGSQGSEGGLMGESRTGKDKPGGVSSQRAKKPAADRTARPSDPVFNDWLQQQLETFYGEIVDEPVPQSLIDLIKRHQKKS